jgi:hypothetical protein
MNVCQKTALKHRIRNQTVGHIAKRPTRAQSSLRQSLEIFLARATPQELRLQGPDSPRAEVFYGENQREDIRIATELR